MRKLFWSLFLIVGWAAVTFGQTQQAHYGTAAVSGLTAKLPDPAVTPGVVRTPDSHLVCGVSTKKFRHTTAAMKDQVYKDYGVQRNKGICAGGCEVDHLIPLELGGQDDVRNLWPQPSQPKPGFHEKDKVENALNKSVCSGEMNLADAQKAIRTNWLEVYAEISSHKP